MSQIGNVLGWPLFQMPATPGQRQVEWSMVNINGSLQNPYTGQEQIQSWNAGYWEAVVTMPPMNRSSAEAWVAFMAGCQGMNACFYFGDGLGVNAQGEANGPGVTAGSFQGGYSLITTAWTPNQFVLFSPGDWIQLGYRLHKVLDQVGTDSGGNASFAIWPPVREVPANGTPIITMGAKGLFRMKNNVQKFSISYLRTWGLSFEIREAI